MDMRKLLAEIAGDISQYLFAHSWIIGLWVLLVTVSVILLSWDLRMNNQEFTKVLSLIWIRIILSLGPVGLVLYWYVRRDSSS